MHGCLQVGLFLFVFCPVGHRSDLHFWRNVIMFPFPSETGFRCDAEVSNMTVQQSFAFPFFTHDIAKFPQVQRRETLILRAKPGRSLRRGDILVGPRNFRELLEGVQPGVKVEASMG